MNSNSQLSTVKSAQTVRGAAVRRVAVALAFGMGAAVLVSAPVHAAPIDSLVKGVKFDDDKGVAKDIANGMDPNATDDQGMPLLVLAAREKSDKVAAVLLDNPAIKINAQDKAGENALMLASLNGDVDLVKMLITKGADVNKQGWTPLHYAAANGNDDVAKLLIGYSADVNAQSPNGTTPLMMAARGDHMSTANLLLDHGANLQAKNQIGMNALDFAKQYKAPDAIKDLSARMGQAAQ
ncbi:ankyrin repeat domain-containing protein [Paraburkholderia tropica]|uniref:ankyrin repeat domain-containing protein n=1 Tax=Paraburkholderia tropica TaxID=92647 RepID=UPI000F5435DC|nr:MULTISPECIES: ankyrin repeat domain-containing protein [Paraburkholderia]RQM48479.1 ankyrin repeat domain-containing protein [Paraburkholderia bannensis]